ncbi:MULTISPECIES: hypothetical protein [Mesorhizobium]|uniref:hypothetical protein n=1 Tax=Mesorhizobium australicum TaxID=536018 RepID=UPI00333BF214
MFGQKQKSRRPGLRASLGLRSDLSGSFACSARHWTPVQLPVKGFVYFKAGNVPVYLWKKIPNGFKMIGALCGDPIRGD